MNTVERIKTICKENKIPISKLEKECGFANGYISQLKKGTMPADRLEKVAVFLGYSSEYLLKGSVPEIPERIDRDTIELVELFNKLNKEQRTAVMNLLRSFAL